MLQNDLCKYIKSLPNDVIINNIIPYTYNVQPKKLLHDIRSFYLDFNMTENYYYIYYNPSILLNDLIHFYYYNEDTYSITNKYYKIFKRHFMFQDCQYITIANYIFTKFHTNLFDKPIIKIKFLWGLLKPNERAIFIDTFVMEKIELI